MKGTLPAIVGLDLVDVSSVHAACIDAMAEGRTPVG
jgi:hypothetical protein